MEITKSRKEFTILRTILKIELTKEEADNLIKEYLEVNDVPIKHLRSRAYLHRLPKYAKLLTDLLMKIEGY